MEKLPIHLAHSYNKLFNLTNTAHCLPTYTNLITKRDFGAVQLSIKLEKKNFLTSSLKFKSAPLSSNFATISIEPLPAAA